ncbi:MAG: hypothetical protein P8184_19925, partial [Calditrichia bacterium]
PLQLPRTLRADRPQSSAAAAAIPWRSLFNFKDIIILNAAFIMHQSTLKLWTQKSNYEKL